MYLYICDNYSGSRSGKDRTDELIMKSLALFLEESDPAGKVSLENVDIIRTEKGKPYFCGLPEGTAIEFSVSHTDDLWACLMSWGDMPVGVDIQKTGNYNYDRIASRYYTEAEQEHVKKAGASGFFDIWVRKEAYAKYTGEGLGKYLRTVSSGIETLFMPGGDKRHGAEGERVRFVDIDIREDVKGTCCISEAIADRCDLKEIGGSWIRKI